MSSNVGGSGVETNLSEQKRDQFKSRIGFIFATAGSAVGLGNIWRFPYMTGENGGGAFVLIYLLCLAVVGVSMLLVEFSIGRYGKSNAVDSYGKVSKYGKWIGYLGFFSAFIFLSYYSVVGGWTIFFTLKSATGLTSVAPDAMGAFFGNFIGHGTNPLIFHLIFMALTISIVAKGVSGGIEKYSKYLMPALFGMIVILVVRSVTLPGALEGIKWYLTPDFSKITGKTWIAALGQVFFSLSVGMSGMVTYASYLSNKEELPQTAVKVALTDTLVALLAGFMIFPAIFAFSLEPAGGPGLVFITLPIVFSKMPVGALFSFIFFALLIIASLTSSISILEMPVTFIIEKFKLSRVKAALIVGGISYILGVAVSLSFGAWSDFLIFGKNIFGLFDYFGSNIVLPLSSLGAALLVGYLWKKEGAIGEISNYGKNKFSLNTTWFYVVKFIIPVVIVLVFLSSIEII